MTSASKVGDLFTSAGEAFSTLAELIRILQTASKHISNENNFSEAWVLRNKLQVTNVEKNGSHIVFIKSVLNYKQWLDSDTELLHMAVKRFGDDLNVISEHIKDKTMCQIKTTFRKIQPTLSNTTTASNEKSGTDTTSGIPAATFGGHDAANAYSSDSVVSSSALSSMVTPASAKTSAAAQNATASNSYPQAPSTGGVNATAATAAASCSSPSPFLHYPLLRKSADITLNMLNARDDSDDDERVSMSVFNSV